jgi:phosphoglycolate phosphatase
MNLIALDLDGTIEDSRADMIASVRRVRKSFSLPVRNEREIASWINRGMDLLYRNCFDDFLAGGDGPGRYQEVRRAYEKDYGEHVACETVLYPGMERALAELAAIGPLAVVTNKPEAISRRLLEALKISGLISALVGADRVGRNKPDPELLREAGRRVRFDEKGRTSVMIGDSDGDIQMGAAFGSRTIWCAWGYAPRPGIAPDRVAGRPDELPGIVREFSASPGA